MMNEGQLEAAVDWLAKARHAQERVEHLPENVRPRGEAEAYQIQDRLHARLQAIRGTRRIGRKIGCTTDVMQRYLRINSPCAGGLFEDSVHKTPAQLDYSHFRRVGVECEIAVRLEDDLPTTAKPHHRDSVGVAIKSCMAAIEIVDDRYLDYSTFDTPTLIADDFFNAGAVLGPEVEDWRSMDLAGLKGGMTVDGKLIGEGLGAAILGHPFEALAWLANALNARGQALRAGELVMLGSLVQTQWLDRGQRAEITIDGLGGAAVRFD